MTGRNVERICLASAITVFSIFTLPQEVEGGGIPCASFAQSRTEGMTDYLRGLVGSSADIVAPLTGPKVRRYGTLTINKENEALVLDFNSALAPKYGGPIRNFRAKIDQKTNIISGTTRTIDLAILQEPFDQRGCPIRINDPRRESHYRLLIPRLQQDYKSIPRTKSQQRTFFGK